MPAAFWVRRSFMDVMAQGYVVAANGRNPLSDINGPQQVDGITVEIGGETKPITPCSPCVTVGLTRKSSGSSGRQRRALAAMAEMPA